MPQNTCHIFRKPPNSSNCAQTPSNEESHPKTETSLLHLLQLLSHTIHQQNYIAPLTFIGPTSFICSKPKDIILFHMSIHSTQLQVQGSISINLDNPDFAKFKIE
ncbi:hypothetical protein JHK87_027921 [Glycine soja]|nr:hypothetical protein JHK87_027921 [Glycine soja]